MYNTVRDGASQGLRGAKPVIFLVDSSCRPQCVGLLLEIFKLKERERL